MKQIDERLVAFCRDLIRTPSLAQQERNVAHRVRDELKALGFDDVETDEYGSVVGVLKNGEGPTIVFDAHLDTVGVEPISEWSYDPFGAWVEDGRIYGRGAMDMKGPAAAMIYGLASLITDQREFKGTIIASLSTLEEVAEGVALAHIIDIYGADIIVICEASNLKLVRAQRGRAEVAVRTQGVPAHSSTPHLGVDAVRKMMRLIQRMSEMPMPSHPFLGHGVLALTDIISTPYPAMSTVPWGCRATFDRRLLIGETEKSVLDEINAMIEEAKAEDKNLQAEAEIATISYQSYTGKEFTFKKFLPAWEMAEDHPVVKTALDALVAAGVGSGTLGHYKFCTNGSLPDRHFGKPTIGFGPGDELYAHRKDEYINIDDLLAASRGYTTIAKALSHLET